MKENEKTEHPAKRRLKVASRSPQACVVAIVLFFAFAVLFGFGASYLADKENDAERNDKVNKYKEAVRIWKLSGFERFQKAVNWTVDGIIQATEKNTNSTMMIDIKIALQPNNEKNSLLDPSAKDFPDYTALHYNYSGPILLSSDQWSDIQGILCFKSKAGDFNLSVEYTRTESYGPVGWKVCDYQHEGAYVGSNCFVYLQLDKICIQVSYSDETRSWYMNDRSPLGCDAQKPTIWNKYKTVSVSRYQGPSKVNITSTDIQLYADEDPYILADKISGGTFNFGLSKHERVVNGIAFIGAAVASLLVSLSLILCCWKEFGYFADPALAPKYSSQFHDIDLMYDTKINEEKQKQIEEDEATVPDSSSEREMNPTSQKEVPTRHPRHVF